MSIRDTLVEVVGFLAFATNVWGNLLIARKSKSGWIVRLVSNALWFAFGLGDRSVANIANAATFAGINVYGFRRWRKEQAMRQVTCVDHHKILCRWCHEIVRQCRCCPGSDKPTTYDGVCGTCARMLPVPSSELVDTPASSALDAPVVELSVAERQALRAKHTCMRDMSSRACHACNTGVPYPTLTIQEIGEAMGDGRDEREASESALLARPGRRR